MRQMGAKFSRSSRILTASPQDRVNLPRDAATTPGRREGRPFDCFFGCGGGARFKKRVIWARYSKCLAKIKCKGLPRCPSPPRVTTHPLFAPSPQNTSLYIRSIYYLFLVFQPPSTTIDT